MAGFAAGTHCVPPPLHDIGALYVTSLYPAKGGGGDWIALEFKSGKRLTLYEGGHQQLSDYGKRIQAVLGIPVWFVDAGADCRMLPGRQCPASA